MSWYELHQIYVEAVDEARQAKRERPSACPNDGEPLLYGADGTWFCRYDGYSWPE